MNFYTRHRLQETSNYAEEDVKTEALYDSVRGVLDRLTPQTVETLANELEALEIDTPDRLQGVVNLVYEKAIETPSLRRHVAIAQLCRKLASMQVSGSEGKVEKEESNVNFRKLIITRCQIEFIKNTADKTAKAIKLKEIDATTDPEKKKKLLLMRFKFVDTIRFIGELFNQGMLSSGIMHRCINHLVKQIDEESLECLCVLLTTVGKILESRKEKLDTYFNRMMDIVNGKVPGKVSPRVRFMLQDVIELRMNNWVPRRDGPIELNGRNSPIRGSRQRYSVETHKLKNKPPPMDHLQIGNNNMFQWSRNDLENTPKTVTPNKHSVLDIMPSDQDRRTPLPLSGSTPTAPRDCGRSDYESSYDGRKSRNGSQQINSRSFSEDDWLHDTPRSQSMSPPQPIESVPPPAPVSVPIEAMPILTEEQLIKKTANIPNEFLADTNINNPFIEIRETFDNSTFANFVREALNYAVEKESAAVRQHVSQLMTHLIVNQTLPLSLYLTGLGEFLATAEDLVIDFPKIWVHLAELICYPLARDTMPFSELKNIVAPLKNARLGEKLLGELLTLLVQEKGPNWTTEKWEKAGLQWSDFLQENESVPDFIKKCKLEFMEDESNSGISTSGGQLSMERIRELLYALLSNEKEYSFDDINSWISANVGSRAIETQFIQILVTAILKVSIEPHNGRWQFNKDRFENLQPLITRYVAADELLESHCLIAIQEYIHQLERPKGVLFQVIFKLWLDDIISEKVFLVWAKNDYPAARAGKSVGMMDLRSFFTLLQKEDDESSGTDA